MIMILVFLTVAMAFLLSLSKKQFASHLIPWAPADEKKDALLITHFLEKMLMIASAPVSLKSALEKYQNKEMNLRQAVIQMALSDLAYWPAILFLTLCMNISGVYLAGITALVLILLESFKSKASAYQKLKAYGVIIFFVGLSLVFFEQALRSSGQMMMMAHEFDWIFYISQGEVDHMIVLFLVSMLITFVLRLEAWSFIFSLMMLVSGLLAFNNALAFVAGELIATTLIFIWQTHRAAITPKKEFYAYAGISIFMHLVMALFVVFNKEVLFSKNVGQIMDVASRLEAFVGSIVLILFAKTVAVCLWGHLWFRKHSQARP